MTRASTLRSRMLGNSHVRFWRRAGAGDCSCLASGYSVIAAAHTYLNIQAEARDGVKKAEEQSTRQRRTRRGRKTPCRKPRQNRQQSKKKLPPSTKARWQWKLRLARFLCQLFPVHVFVVEDIKARTQGKGAGIKAFLRWK